MDETEFVINRTLISGGSGNDNKDQTPPPGTAAGTSATSITLLNGGGILKKPSVHFAEVLEAVKEYNVSGTSSEDSAESDDLERLPAATEGDTKSEQTNDSNSNSEILKMIAQGSIMKSNLVGSASQQAAQDSKPKARRWAGIRTGRFEVVKENSSPNSVETVVDGSGPKPDAEKGHQFTSALKIEIEPPAPQATLVLTCEAGSSPFKTRHIRLTEGVPVNVGRYLSTPPGSDGRLQSQTLSGSDEVRCYPHDHNALFECKVLSRQHATLTYKAPKFFLRDLDSSNGTFLVTEGGKLNQLKNKEMEVFTSDVVQFGVDVVDNSSRGTMTSRSGTGSAGAPNIVHKPVIARMKLMMPSGRVVRERTRRDTKSSENTLSTSSSKGKVDGTDAEDLLVEIRRAAKLHFAQNQKGDKLMEKLDRLERLFVTHNNASFVSMANDLTVTKNDRLSQKPPKPQRKKTGLESLDRRLIVPKTTSDLDGTAINVRIADLSQLATRVTEKLADLEKRMFNHENSSIMQRLEALERRSETSYLLLKSSNSAIIYLSMFFALLLMVIALRDGVRDHRRLAIW